ncbi:MAG: hypothetical protein JSW39_14025 [Desulfobacterales bacterium]|nr:MAG: hypothetical protein JSW39_14025 [Desulfobacterales bacterium]
MKFDVDVLCVGHASYDLVFSIDHHPGPDEKSLASQFFSSGGGPAANAAVGVARLGYTAAFAGYLGDDLYGQKHFQELQANGVIADFVVKGPAPTPLSAILVKPDGKRTVVNYRGQTAPLPETKIDFSLCVPKVILFDGHEPHISLPLSADAERQGVLTVLDAGSVHDGTRALAGRVTFMVASEKFARDFTGEKDILQAAIELSQVAPAVIVTCGEAGLVWRRGSSVGRLGAYRIDAVDTTGAGDAFHGAFAAGLAAGREWEDLLRYASAAAALCCTQYGARPALPTAQEVAQFLKYH